MCYQLYEGSEMRKRYEMKKGSFKKSSYFFVVLCVLFAVNLLVSLYATEATAEPRLAIGLADESTTLAGTAADFRIWTFLTRGELLGTMVVATDSHSQAVINQELNNANNPFFDPSTFPKHIDPPIPVNIVINSKKKDGTDDVTTITGYTMKDGKLTSTTWTITLPINVPDAQRIAAIDALLITDPGPPPEYGEIGQWIIDNKGNPLFNPADTVPEIPSRALLPLGILLGAFLFLIRKKFPAVH